MLKLIICGINGVMGTHIYNQAIAKGHEIICGIDKKTVANIDCPVYSDFDQIRHLADVIIDFSSPTLTSKLLSFATENSIPLVIGTTGHSLKHNDDILHASKKIPIFKSANTSLGVYAFIQICKTASLLLNDYDIEIVEKHHKYKKDSPSGTANLILDNLSNNINSTNIRTHSIRGGSIVGEHSVLFLGEGESITLTHNAESKQLFAKGAIKACEFICKQQNGLFDMKDL